MTDADITAFRAAPVPPRPRRHRVWPWLLGALLLISVLAVGALVTLVSTVNDWTGDGVHLTITTRPSIWPACTAAMRRRRCWRCWLRWPWW